MTQKLLDLFREPHNMDTAQIAAHLGGAVAGWTEARVYNEIAKEKATETAQGPSYAKPKLIRYAGFDRSSMALGGR